METKTKDSDSEENNYYKSLITNLNHKLKNEELKSKQENARIIRVRIQMICFFMSNYLNSSVLGKPHVYREN